MAPAIQVVGLVLRRRLFSLPLSFETAANGQADFLLQGPELPDYLHQFQEVLDLALGSLPGVDWQRCSRGDAIVQMMVRQMCAPIAFRSEEATRAEEPADPQEVFMNLPHHDDYWPGADYFVVSDAPHRTLFYPRGAAEAPVQFPSYAVVRYDALSLHSAPGFCAGALRQQKATAPSADRARVLRTFVRIMAWDPLWSARRFPDFFSKLSAAPAQDWQRPSECQAEDVIQGCFDAANGFPCERCCDLRRGALGDSTCWAGWMTYEKCCGPASRRWAGCGWRMGADMWAHDYFSMEPPRLHSAAQCQQRCKEDTLCGGWTYFPQSWQPVGCRLPLAAVMGLRRVCLLRDEEGTFVTPHRDMVWGLRECTSQEGHDCLEVGLDRSGHAVALLREIPDAAACRSQCLMRGDCQSFAFFPDHYGGDASEECIMPPELVSWWAARCLLKTSPTAEGAQMFLPMGNVVAGSRSCPLAAPWVQPDDVLPQSAPDTVMAAQNASLAVDGDYRRESCATRSPWRLELDAEYSVLQAILWFGDLSELPVRRGQLRRYAVSLAVDPGTGNSEQEVVCGWAVEVSGGTPVTVDCSSPSSSRAARAVVVRADQVSNDFSLCEIELRLAPVLCEDLIEDVYIIHSPHARISTLGAAKRPADEEVTSEACERRGGSLAHVRGREGALVCLEAACAPSACLEEFDQGIELYAPLSGFDLWDARAEAAAAECASHRVTGTFYEASVVVHIGGRSDSSDDNVAILHWSLCAPARCGNDDAARAAVRVAAGKGVALSALPPRSEIEVRGVRPLAGWEDVDLDFLVAGFARSGTHSVLLNLGSHEEVRISKQDLTFNWGYVPMQQQIQFYASLFEDGLDDQDSSTASRQLRGGKGEGVALNARILRLLSRARRLKLVVVVREPVEWLESLYNLRALECRRADDCGTIPSLEDVILQGETFKDVRAQDASFSSSLEVAMAHFPPGSGRLLLLEFELLRSRPREFFDRLCSFLGISPFPSSHSFGKFGIEERAQYTSMGTGTSLCSEGLRPALAELRRRLSGEHQRLSQLLAASGAPWVSSRFILNRTHCD